MNFNMCAIGITFLLASVYTAFIGPKKDIFVKFTNLLTPEQQEKYDDIVQERLKIYATALFSGWVIGMFYWFKYKGEPFMWCKYLAISNIVTLGVYYVYPKSPLMLYSLTTKAQTDAWADIYQEMKYRYKVSLLIGFLGYLIISSSL